ncbi:UNVERIFIED_CONTAM: hypothetical protein RMT77_007595 [Armadillidium vulgare]
MKKILCVGLVVVDIVTELDHYPEEDSDNRCHKLWRQRGGNASNNCTVLAILGANPYFCGTISDSDEKKFIEEDFKNYGVEIGYSVVVEGTDCPRSCVLTSLSTGSRTIVHYNKNLRELKLEEFCSIDLSQFSWINFEGRNVSEVKQMISVVRDYNKKVSKEEEITISVELEKAKEEMNDLISLGDIVFLSKEYARFRGWNTMEEALSKVAELTLPETTAICAWGEKGAGAIVKPQKDVLTSPSFAPVHVVDTLGAGDTFIASTILALSMGLSVEKSITFGCKVAGFKIGLRGWEEFRQKIGELECLKVLKIS